jgi:putative serine protease PepD
MRRPQAMRPLREGEIMKGRFFILMCLIAATSAGGVSWALQTSNATVTSTVQTTSGATLASATTGTLTAGQIYTASSKGVVEIKTTTHASGYGPPGFDQSGSAQGTGFQVDTKGDIVTNNHVISDGTSIRVTLRDGTSYPATVVAKDASNDLAILRINAPASELHPLSLASSSSLKVGDAVLAIGDPYGLTDTATAGIVSALDRTITAPNGSKITNAIQTDAALNSGNSGGPLLNASGQVIGVNSQIESQSGGNVGIGFAVPSNTVKTLLDHFAG